MDARTSHGVAAARAGVEPIVAIAGLIKTFGEVRALDGLDLTVRRGQVHGFLGPNGAGKTTTLRILLGLQRPDAGRVLLFGAEPWSTAPALHDRLAYVPGEVALWPGLTGGQTIDVLGRSRGRFDEGRRDRLIDRFGLEPRTKVSAYSKGNRQKVALIAALACDVDLYLFDEPTGGLDPLMAEVFREEVRALVADGRTVLLSSHVLSEVDAVCDHVTIVRAGRTVESGALAGLRHLARSTVIATTAERADLDGVEGVEVVERGVADDGAHRLAASCEASALPGLLERLTSAGVRGLETRPPTLEEMFLRYYDGTHA
jgi:ABC-2 type transport system ATP-binding protein